MNPLIAMESLLINAVTGNPYERELKDVRESVFKNDLDFDRLKKHLGVLVDVVRQAFPEVRKVTCMQTVCETMSTFSYRSMLPVIYTLLHLYFTVPITSSTSERSFFNSETCLNISEIYND